MSGGQDAGTLRRHLDTVEKTMSEVGWSGRIARQLADQLGVSKRTIYRYRTQVMEDLADSYESKDPKHDRAEFLSRLRSYQVKAAAGGKWGSLASMMNVEARVLGLDKITVEHAYAPADTGSSLAQRYRRVAEHAGAAADAIEAGEATAESPRQVH